VLAARAAEKALQMWNAAPTHSQMRRLELLAYQAEAEYLNGEPGKADAGFARVMAELQRLGRERGELADAVRNYRISAAIASGDPRLALALINETISVLARDLPDRPPPAVTLYERGLAMAELGRYDQAVAGFATIAASTEAQDGLIAQRALFDLAMNLSRLGRADEAEKAYLRAVAVAGPVSGDEIEVGRQLARAQLDFDGRKYERARAHLDEALKFKGPVPSIANAYRLRGLAKSRAGDMDGGIRDLRAALDLSLQLRGDKPYSSNVGLAQLGLGQVLQARGDILAARQAYESALAQFSNTVDPVHPDLKATRYLLQRLAGQQERTGS
jgi:tetratricopeptide (TPR) repeat protein